MHKPPIVNVDFSELEKRVEESMAKVGHIDLHTLTAAQMFGVMYSNVTTDQRKAAKCRNFSIAYSPELGIKALVPDAEVMKRVFTETELAELCKHQGVDTAEQLVEVLRQPFPRTSTVTHRVTSDNPQPHWIK